jgi:hypothetical protein
VSVLNANKWGEIKCVANFPECGKCFVQVVKEVELMLVLVLVFVLLLLLPAAFWQCCCWGTSDRSCWSGPVQTIKP